jgi:hypothetical protein
MACGEARKAEPTASVEAAPAPALASPAPPDDAKTASAPLETAPRETASEGEGAVEWPKPPPLTPVGVPECDKFVEKFVACLERHVPEEQQEGKLRELNTHRARWRELLNMQDGKIAASLACRGVAQRLKSDLIVDFGCEF